MDDEADRATRLRLGLRWLVGCAASAMILIAAWFAYGAAIDSPVTMTAAAGVFAAVLAAGSSWHAALRTRLDLIAAEAEPLADASRPLYGSR
ncbi:hypothetical protein ACFC14_06625 [Microbacterium sp. NPDC055988]|uniref:hypothetical protein n=1 Tax=Microbacterium sp. NPDC055988 TaxID=3345671 RepID=UPI0035D7948D